MEIINRNGLIRDNEAEDMRKKKRREQYHNKPDSQKLATHKYYLKNIDKRTIYFRIHKKGKREQKTLCELPFFNSMITPQIDF